MTDKYVITTGSVSKDYGVSFDVSENTTLDVYLKEKGLPSFGRAIKRLAGH